MEGVISAAPAKSGTRDVSGFSCPAPAFSKAAVLSLPLSIAQGRARNILHHHRLLTSSTHLAPSQDPLASHHRDHHARLSPPYQKLTQLPLTTHTRPSTPFIAATTTMSSYYSSPPSSPMSSFFPTGPASPHAFSAFQQSPRDSQEMYAALASRSAPGAHQGHGQGAHSRGHASQTGSLKRMFGRK
ncbi:hypothetical protein BN946_scf185013.g75 [Trametes cinnabarina]|uniref:Uncharacterized protein n=1 Tax=Pycnoporus cinnabarinus TaxID=5643 RepID=A0A060SGD1_PYCCI|nr:hypothetical protein BN946_scf185013.g75 [Trametes cinnabarina]